MTQHSKFNTPVLLIIFNRPETTFQVFEAIKKIKPPRLYIAADGPRPEVPTDAVNCAKARKVTENVDWECEVKMLFSDQNLNCGKGPSSAITWFFENEEKGIILEDDCLPSQSFFWYCQELLDYYENDVRIMHIGGNNFQGGWQKDRDYSYYFSRSGHIWGWASWRRAWQKFDFGIGQYNQIKSNGFFDHFFLNRFEKFYRLRKLDKTAAKKGNADWWDYQWDFARYINNGLAIVPNVNLVKNIGFGSGATHTTNTATENIDMEAGEMEFPLRHPPFVIRDLASDNRYFTNLLKDIGKSKIKNVLAHKQ